MVSDSGICHHCIYAVGSGHVGVMSCQSGWFAIGIKDSCSGGSFVSHPLELINSVLQLIRHRRDCDLDARLHPPKKGLTKIFVRHSGQLFASNGSTRSRRHSRQKL